MTNKGKPFIIIITAVLIVFVLSFVPWGNLTNGYIKDYNLLGDLFPRQGAERQQVGGNEFIDPLLKAELEASPKEAVEEEAISQSGDTVPAVHQLAEEANPRVNGEMVIEDYTPDKSGLSRLKKALGSRGSKPARIAMIGDSYIEGDIFSQDIRRILQQEYGGHGAGYVPAYSNISGFRRSVSVNGEGWTQHEHSQANRSKYFTLMGEYFTADGPAKISYRGTSKEPTLAKWNEAEVLFIAPCAGSITLSADSLSQTFEISASTQVQSVKLQGEMSKLKFDTNIPGLIFLGAWLNDGTGVSLDCMSIRGDSGITRRKVNSYLTAQMREYIDYDLIIVEYGINALTAEQTNYNGYSKLMVEVLRHLQEIYPNADILMLGIGDRGQKGADGIHSLPTAPAMVAAQRQAAREAGVLFWDTREAMGGEDGIVSWRDRQLVNADYIHLNSAGGKELAKELVGSIQKMLKNETQP